MRILLGLAVACLPLLAVPAFADCADEIRSAMIAMANAGPQRIVSTARTKAGVIEMVSEKVPGAMHSRSVSGGVTEFTVVGDRAWSKNGDDWTELPAETAAGFAAGLGAESRNAFENISDAECPGLDRHTFLISYRLTYRDGGAIVKAAIEADPVTGLPRRLQTWNSVAGEKSTAISQFTYDASITVTAPR